MKHLITKLICLLAVIALIFSLVPSVVAVSENNDNEILFGRKQLLKMENGEALTAAYDKIVEGVENREERISLEDLSITEDELFCLVNAYLNDPHGHFWLSNSYSYSMSYDGNILSFNPDYNYLLGSDEKEFIKNVDAFNKAAEDLIRKAGITDDMDEYEKELRLHDVLVRELTYASSVNAHNLYGAIVEKVAVCQGYSYAFNYLLRLCGIEAHYVKGTSHGMSHGWTLVNINGHYYYTDVTWDDPVGSDDNSDDIYHTYFNVTDSFLHKDHEWVPPIYGLPDCDDKDDNFFEHNPEHVITSEPDVEEFAKLFVDGIAYVFVPDDCEFDVVSWFFANAGMIVYYAGYDMTQEISVGCSFMGNEYHLMIITAEDEEPLLGDFDGDGRINAVDANIIKRLLSGALMPTDEQRAVCDINGDGSFNGVDANLLKRILVGNS